MRPYEGDTYRLAGRVRIQGFAMGIFIATLADMFFRYSAASGAVSKPSTTT